MNDFFRMLGSIACSEMLFTKSFYFLGLIYLPGTRKLFLIVKNRFLVYNYKQMFHKMSEQLKKIPETLVDYKAFLLPAVNRG